MSIISYAGQNFFNAAIGANLHIGFNGFEFDGPPLRTLACKGFIDTHQVHKRRMQRPKPICLGAPRVGHGRPGLVVGESGRRDNYRLVELIGRHLAGG